MPRLASLYLPYLSTDRVRANEREKRRSEQNSSPSKLGEELPLLLSHRTGNRLEIAAASPEARALGLHPGMAVAQARALVPGLDIRDHDPEADAAVLRRLALFAARRWTPRAAVSPPDGLVLDLGGVTHLFGGEEEMCRRILAFCERAGFAARIAVAGTAGAAHALARFGSFTFCPPGGEAEALAPLPLAALRVDDSVLAAARRLGLETVGDLLPLPRGPLQRRFGKTLLARLDQALGRSAEPIEPVVPEDAPGVTLRFAEPIATAEAIENAVEILLARLVEALRKDALGVRRLALLGDRIDGAVQRVAVGTSRATRDPDHLRRLIWAKIEKIEPGFGLDSLRLVAGRVEPLGPEQSSLRGAQRRGNPASGAGAAGLLRSARNDEEADLATLVDRLAGRLGPRRLYRSSAVESDVPERSVARVGPLEAAIPWPKWPRPVRLLIPPEPVENVVALLPDQPPRRFTWRGRAYRVARADGPERIYGEWWKRPSEAEGVRDYFQVEDEDGSRFWLYRRGDGVDPRTGDLSWFLHGVFG